MGRLSETEEQRQLKRIQLINVTQEIISKRGLAGVTIRAIGKKADCNSAALYRYFHDLDELLTYACMGVFRTYLADLTKHKKLQIATNKRSIYLSTWLLFCKHAFANAECAYHLFFSKYRYKLDTITTEYFKLFPHELSDTPFHLRPMISTVDLYERNLVVLRPLLNDLVSKNQCTTINELTIAYFQMLLNEKRKGGSAVDNEAQTKRMLRACEFLLSAVASRNFGAKNCR